MKVGDSSVLSKKIKLLVLLVLVGLFNLAPQEEDCCRNAEDGQASPEIITMRVTMDPSIIGVDPEASDTFNVSATCGALPCPPFLWTPLWDATGIETASFTNRESEQTILGFTSKAVDFTRIEQLRLFGFPIPYATQVINTRLFYDAFVDAFPSIRAEQVENVTRIIGGQATVRILANADSPDLQAFTAQGPFLLVSPSATADFGSGVIGLPPKSLSIKLLNRGNEDVVMTEIQATSNETPPLSRLHSPRWRDPSDDPSWVVLYLSMEILPSGSRRTQECFTDHQEQR